MSCCQAFLVPGGSFIRDYDEKEYTSTHYTATVRAFVMDRFEVSVGRLSGFVNAYDHLHLARGDGRSRYINGDTGWQEEYPLPKTSDDLKAALHCPDTTWDDQESGDLNFPANCVDFYVAYAFCIWDGGRLPSEAEWNYAAAGGNQQREYPWSTATDSGLDLDHAFYGQSFGLPSEVGTRPKGNGRWGHSDLSGNINEWTIDYYVQIYPSTICNDCVSSAPQQTRTLRGGAYRFVESGQKVAYRTSGQPDTGHAYTGFRCVHELSTPSAN